MNEPKVWSVFPMQVTQHRPNQKMDHGFQGSSSSCSSSSSFISGALLQSHQSLSVDEASPAASLWESSSTFLFHDFCNGMLLSWGQGPRSVLQHIWNQLYPPVLEVPFQCPVFNSCFPWRILSPYSLPKST